MQLHDWLDQVNDRESFFRFARALVADKEDSNDKEKAHPSTPYGPAANGWENITIETYLDAALSWAGANADRESVHFPPDPSWKAFAVFLYCGKIYE